MLLRNALSLSIHSTMSARANVVSDIVSRAFMDRFIPIEGKLFEIKAARDVKDEEREKDINIF